MRNEGQNFRSAKVESYFEETSQKTTQEPTEYLLSSASQMNAAKVMNVIARLPDCDGQAADAVSAYTQVKFEDPPR